MAENPLVSAGVHGGLVVQIGAGEPEAVVELSRTGRYIAHILETDPGTVDIVRNVLANEGTYGLASAETLIDPTLLPYTENVVNAVLIQSLGKVSLFLDHASGINISFAKGAGCPDIFNNSKTLSKDAESEFPGKITGLTFSMFSNNGLNISCSCTFIQLTFPFNVFISPL